MLPDSFRSAAHASWGWLVARGVFALFFPGAAFVTLAVGFGVFALWAVSPR